MFNRTDKDPDVQAMKDQLAELTAPKPVVVPPVTDSPRISVGVTRDEMHRASLLACRLGTSVSALAQLALRQMLVQIEAGATPMLPVALTATGAEPTYAEKMDRLEEESKAGRARINMLTAQIELSRLADLAGLS